MLFRWRYKGTMLLHLNTEEYRKFMWKSHFQITPHPFTSAFCPQQKNSRNSLGVLCSHWGWVSQVQLFQTTEKQLIIT